MEFNKTDKRTYPTARNTKKIDIYVADKNGVSLYNAQNNSLEKKYNKDIRADIALYASLSKPISTNLKQ